MLHNAIKRGWHFAVEAAVVVVLLVVIYNQDVRFDGSSVQLSLPRPTSTLATKFFPLASTCGSWTCNFGTLISNANTTTCGTNTTGDCSDKTCCDITYCSSYTGTSCKAGWVNVTNPSEVPCKNTTCTFADCCSYTNPVDNALAANQTKLLIGYSVYDTVENLTNTTAAKLITAISNVAPLTIRLPDFVEVLLTSVPAAGVPIYRAGAESLTVVLRSLTNGGSGSAATVAAIVKAVDRSKVRQLADVSALPTTTPLGTAAVWLTDIIVISRFASGGNAPDDMAQFDVPCSSEKAIGVCRFVNGACTAPTGGIAKSSTTGYCTVTSKTSPFAVYSAIAIDPNANQNYGTTTADGNKALPGTCATFLQKCPGTAKASSTVCAGLACTAVDCCNATGAGYVHTFSAILMVLLSAIFGILLL